MMRGNRRRPRSHGKQAQVNGRIIHNGHVTHKIPWMTTMRREGEQEKEVLRKKESVGERLSLSQQIDHHHHHLIGRTDAVDTDPDRVRLGLGGRTTIEMNTVDMIGIDHDHERGEAIVVGPPLGGTGFGKERGRPSARIFVVAWAVRRPRPSTRKKQPKCVKPCVLGLPIDWRAEPWCTMGTRRWGRSRLS